MDHELILKLVDLVVYPGVTIKMPSGHHVVAKDYHIDSAVRMDMPWRV
jgi:hypothetical protein